MAGLYRVTLQAASAEKKLARIRGRFASLKDVARGPVRALVQDAIRKQFETEGAWGGEPWAPLSPRTIADKEKRGVLWKGILRDSDTMYAYLTGARPGGIRVRSVSRLKFSFDIQQPRYARAHQMGASTGWGLLPSRPLLPEEMPPEFMKALRNIVSGYLVEASFR